MLRFRFRLQKVLDLRAMEEQQAQIALGASQQRLTAEKAQLRALNSDAHVHTELRARRRQSGAEPEEVIRLDHYADALKQAIWRQERRVDEAVQEVESCRRLLQEAMQRREVLTRLEEKRRLEHVAEGLRAEQKSLDDFAVMRFAAARQAGTGSV